MARDFYCGQNRVAPELHRFFKKKRHEEKRNTQVAQECRSHFGGNILFLQKWRPRTEEPQTCVAFVAIASWVPSEMRYVTLAIPEPIAFFKCAFQLFGMPQVLVHYSSPDVVFWGFPLGLHVKIYPSARFSHRAEHPAGSFICPVKSRRRCGFPLWPECRSTFPCFHWSTVCTP